MIPVAFIVCSYNRPDYLREALASASATNVEHIAVVDDASTDPRVRQVITEAIKRDGRITVHYREVNGGESVTANTGIRTVLSDYIMMLHDDDRAIPDGPSRLYNAAQDLAVEAVWGNVMTIDAAGEEKGIELSGPPDRARIWAHDYIHFPAMMWRRDIHRRIGDFDETLVSSQDWDFKIRVLRDCRCAYIPEVVMQYRRHAGMKSTVNAGAILEDCERRLKANREEYRA